VLQPKIGIQLKSLGQPLKKAIQTAAQIGANAVEIDLRNELKPQDLTRTASRHIRKLLDDLNLEVCAASFYTRRGYDVVDDLDRRVEATKLAMNAAYELGANVLINHVGRIPEDTECNAWKHLAQSLADIGSHGQRVGCFLAARTGTEDPQLLRKMIDSLPAGSLTVDFDPGSLIINGFSASDGISLLAPDVVHFHARDGVQDLAQGRGIEVQLGQGSTDLGLILGTLEEHQYRGYFTVQRDNSQNPVLEASQAIRYLKEIFAA